MTQREIRYARSTGDIDIAYRVIGDGPVDLVYVPGFISHLELCWQLPHFSWLEDLDGIARVIVFDKRGTGLSDRSLGFGSLEERADDIRAVMDAAGSERAFIHGVSEGGPMAMLFAAAFPHRVRGLILHGTGARFVKAHDYDIGIAADLADLFVMFVTDNWGSGDVFSLFVQHAPDEGAARRVIARFERNACTPRMAAEIMLRNFEIDVRDTLPVISVPSLVLHSEQDPVVPVECARYVAEHIPGAVYREFPSDVHGSWRPEDLAPWVEEVVRFVSDGSGAVSRIDRVLGTMLFTDICSSTETAGRVGDDAWIRILNKHDDLASDLVDRFGGRVVKTTGDGILAMFDGPARGIRCAVALRDAVRSLGVRIRAGVHTGEIQLRSEDISGMAVAIARRICDRGSADDVLVSRTVKDLVTGSRIDFVDRGTHPLKGVADEWQLFAVRGE